MYKWTIMVLITCAAWTFLACGPSSTEGKLSSEQQTEWTWLQETKASLDQQRAELAELAEKIADPSLIQVEEGAEPPTPEMLQEQYDKLRNTIDTQAEAFQTRLADLLYEFDLELYEVRKKNPEAEMRPEHLAANRMMSSETILIAKRWIKKQGDYRKAIESMEKALENDPDNTELKEALKQAKADQFMTPERFAAIQKLMTQDEVVDLIGQPYRNNKKTYPKQNAEAWFYPREDGGVAGVYFKPDAEEIMKAYKVDYDAVKPKTEEPASTEPESTE